MPFFNKTFFDKNRTEAVEALRVPSGMYTYVTYNPPMPDAERQMYRDELAAAKWAIRALNRRVKKLQLQKGELRSLGSAKMWKSAAKYYRAWAHARPPLQPDMSARRLATGLLDWADHKLRHPIFAVCKWITNHPWMRQ